MVTARESRGSPRRGALLHNRSMSRHVSPAIAVLSLICFTTMGCGGAPAPAAPAGEAATATPDAESGEGAKCIEAASAPREPGPDAPLDMVVSHVLVRHAELEHPQGATRSRADACLRALAARAAFEKGGDWDAVVAEYSDAADAMKGSLGRVSRDQLEETFADAAFALAPNEVSYVVETPRGFHVIFRTE